MDKDHIGDLIDLGMNSESIQRIQDIAANAMKAAGLGYTMHNACAATLSAFLQQAGIGVSMTLGAGNLAKRLRENRRWVRISVGAQRAGDTGVTFDTGGNPGADHVYLVVQRVDDDQMVIADNQASSKHTRYASGKGGKTPTEYFLRAPDEMISSNGLRTMNFLERIDPNNTDFYPWEDEDTNGLPEPFEGGGDSSSLAPMANIAKDSSVVIGEKNFDEFVERLSKSIVKRMR